MTVREFFGRFKREAVHDNLDDLAAMLTYYAVFALFPMALFVLMLAFLIVPQGAVDEAVGMVTRTLPGDIGALIAQQMRHMEQSASGGFAIVAAVVALWGASRGSVSLGHALNTVYDLKEKRPWWKVQLTAILVTVGVAVALVAALALLAFGPIAGHWVADRFGLGGVFDVLWTIGRWVGAAILVMLIWAILYRFLPDTKAPLRVFTVGAVVGVVLWIGVTLLFGVYVSHFGSYQKTFGTLAGVAIFLLWVWLSNLSLLVGAEINDVLDVFQLRPSEEDERRERKAACGKEPPRSVTEGNARPAPGTEHPSPA